MPKFSTSFRNTTTRFALVMVATLIATSVPARATSQVVSTKPVHIKAKGISIQQPVTDDWTYDAGSDCTNIDVKLANSTGKTIVVKVSLRAFWGFKDTTYTGSPLVQIDAHSATDLPLGCIPGEVHVVANSGIVLTGSITKKTLSTFNFSKIKFPAGVKRLPINLTSIMYNPITRTTDVLLSATDSVPGSVLRLKNIKINGKKVTHNLYEFTFPINFEVSTTISDTNPPTYAVVLANIKGNVVTGRHFKVTGTVIREPATILNQTFTVQHNPQPISEFSIPDPAGWKYDAATNTTTVWNWLPKESDNSGYDLSNLQLSTTDAAGNPLTRTSAQTMVHMTGAQGMAVDLFTLPGDWRSKHPAVTVLGNLDYLPN